jgi:hypothetical protein
MKKLLIIYACVLFVACKHDEEIKQSAAERALVGEVNLDMAYYDFIPDIDMDTIIANPNNYRLDLNQDKKDDISIRVSGDNGDASIVFYSLNAQANKMGFSCSDVETLFVSGGTFRNCFGRVTTLPYRSVLNNNLCKWSVTDSISADNYILINREYTYKYYYASDTLQWHPIPNQYIGFRFIENTDTLYGWMRLSIIGKAHIVVHDLAYQKRLK